MSHVVLHWCSEHVLADLVEVSGYGQDRQVRFVLPSDPDFPDADQPVEVWLHVSELTPRLAESVLAVQSA